MKLTTGTFEQLLNPENYKDELTRIWFILL